MESRVKFLGHPVHPMLVVLPLGLLSAAVVFDILYVITGNAEFATFSFWAIAAGVVGGLAAGIFGTTDWLALPAGTRAKRLGLLHGGGNGVLIALFAFSWILRLGDPTYLPGLAPMLVGVAGAAVAAVTAWLGGELVYRLRVGVDRDANLDAPSSLRAGAEADAVPRTRS